MAKVTLTTTPEQFDGLNHAAHPKVARGKRASVDRQALVSLLIDHGRLIGYIGKDNLEGQL